MARKHDQAAARRDSFPVPPALGVRFILRDGQSLAVLSFVVPEVEIPTNLTEAEKQVVDAVLRGLSNSEIALARRRSPRTIANQLAAIFRKLGVSSRNELVALLSRDQRDHSRTS